MRWKFISRIVLFSLVVLLPGVESEAGPVADAPPDPAQRYRVVGIGPSDQLNVREQPADNATIIGRLQPDEKGIVVTGLRSRTGDGVWWQIVHKEASRGTGWVNGGLLSQEQTAERESGFALLCRGTEPLWSLRLADGEGRFSRIGEADMTWRAAPWTDAAGLLPGWRFAIRLDGSNRAQTGWTIVSRATAACSDQMSDFEYPYDTTVITPDRGVLAGCCTRAR